MIIVKLIGGLGNQMFQYAAGRALSYSRGLELYLHPDFSGENITPRSYRLGNFNIIEKFAKPDQISLFWSKKYPYSLKKMLVSTQNYYPFMKHGYLNDKLVYFCPDIIHKFHNIYLDGFWQSENFFQNIKLIIKDEFTIKKEPSQLNKKIIGEMLRHESVSVHVRRGDYITNLAALQHHGVCPRGYYLDAIDKLKEYVKNPHFYIFSDDLDWCKENLQIPYQTTFINQNGADYDYEDLRLMTMCKHHIIANSSFSWWGAWLSGNEGKIVFAPKKWFRTHQFNENDIIPNSWNKI